MTNNRPYRKALSKEDALVEIVKFKGTQFDPTLVDTFVELIIFGDHRTFGSGY